MNTPSSDSPHQPIPPASVQKLAEAIEEGRVDDSSRLLFQAELDYLRNWREKRGRKGDPVGPQQVVGLALSGGGIRSATFSLGVMQALAHRGLLKEVDYLSTVSGGGYIGSSLTWLVSHKAEKDYQEAKGGDAADLHPGVERRNFPFGADDPDPELKRDAPQTDSDPKPSDAQWQRRILSFLRHHGYYLTPGAGIDALSLLGVVLRGTLLNLLVWIPLLVLFFLIGSTVFGLAHQLASGAHPFLQWALESLPILEWVFESLQPDIPCNPGIDSIVTVVNADIVCADLKFSEIIQGVVTNKLPYLWGFELFLWAGLLMLFALLVGTVLYSVLTWHKHTLSRRRQAQWYEFRRRAERLSSLVLSLLVVFLVIGTLPIVAVYLHSWVATAGPVAMLAGMGLAIRHFLATARNGSGEPSSLLISLGAGLFFYGVAVVAFLVAFVLFPSASAIGQTVLMVILVAVPLVTGWFVNLNYISIHRYYRDRLMETFMPDLATALAGRTGKAAGANDVKLHELEQISDPRGPYHIVNTNVILVDSYERTYRTRGGDNFILSPLYCGSNATGWWPTNHFMGGKMTLATAAAISGAAANPNTGVGGEGPTRNRVLSLLMALLNLRLGYWADNPRHSAGHLPNHYVPGLYAFGSALGLARTGLNERRDFLELSDGGHFENTAVYELVRRRVGLIIVCDGGADKDFSFSDFQTTVRRIEDDFGVHVMMYEGATPDDLMPEPEAAEESLYPAAARFSKQGHMVGRITYSDDSRGFLIYLKTTLIKQVSFKVKGYTAQNPDFPDQTTADQFFEEVQFEAYRALGYRLADLMLDDEIPAAAIAELEASYGREIAGKKPTNEALIRYCCAD